MTDKQVDKVRKNAYKFYDEVIYENQGWSKRDIALSSFYAGADYVLKNKRELQEFYNLPEFLSREGVLIEFIENVCTFHNKCSTDIIVDALHGTIGGAFSWDDTPQGFEYWENLSRKFNQL